MRKDSSTILITIVWSELFKWWPILVAVVKSGLKIFALSLFYEAFGPIMYKEIFPRNPRDRNSLHLCNFPWILAFRPHHSNDMLPDDVRSRNRQLGQVAVVKSGLKIFALSLFYGSFGPIMYNERFICEWKIELCSIRSWNHLTWLN